MIKRLLVLIFLVGMGATAFGQADSLGVERKDGKLLVLHKVQSGQTLYALARRYGASVKQIRDANPILQQGLKVGQTIKVPYGKPLAAEKPQVAAAKTHTVAAGETLYAISRKYNITVEELMKLNNLSSNALSRGQKLIVAAAEVAPDPKPETVEPPPASENATETTNESSAQTGNEETTTVDTTAVTSEVEVTTDPVTTPQETATEAEVPVKYNGTTFKEVIEEGVAVLIEEEEPAKKFLALHKTAKVGTVIKIRNVANDLAVYVRVIGQIPDTGDNENVLIQLNKRAYDQLKAVDPRIRVELSYFQ